LNRTAQLEGGCLVSHHSELEFEQQGSLRWCRFAGRPEGARKLSQFYLELEHGNSGNISFNNSEVVLYLTAGNALINIAGCEFQANKGSGVHIRCGEAFSLMNESNYKVCLTATVCPGTEDFQLSSADLNGFDDRYPVRVIDAKHSEKQDTGDRFYQLLIGPQTSSGNVTQFIGMIPLSKAPEHFHLYEEAIYILSGSGHMWAGESQAAVRKGSMIFLPAEQAHCLECTDPAGMLLVGSFYPAGSPAVNYETAEKQ
jgi:quercetin dioxygenase-like cupin family protein